MLPVPSGDSRYRDEVDPTNLEEANGRRWASRTSGNLCVGPTHQRVTASSAISTQSLIWFIFLRDDKTAPNWPARRAISHKIQDHQQRFNSGVGSHSKIFLQSPNAAGAKQRTIKHPMVVASAVPFVASLAGHQCVDVSPKKPFGRRVEEGRGIETYWNRPVSVPRSSVGSRAGAIAPQARPICCSP